MSTTMDQENGNASFEIFKQLQEDTDLSIEECMSMTATAAQLKMIHQTQDEILGDLRKEMSKIEVENYVLQKLNYLLLSEKKYWEKMYKTAAACANTPANLPDSRIVSSTETRKAQRDVETQKSFSAEAIPQARLKGCASCRKHQNMSTPAVINKCDIKTSWKNIRTLRNKSTNTMLLASHTGDKRQNQGYVQYLKGSTNHNGSSSSSTETLPTKKSSSKVSELTENSLTESQSSDSRSSKVVVATIRNRKQKRKSTYKKEKRHAFSGNEGVAGCFKFFRKSSKKHMFYQ